VAASLLLVAACADSDDAGVQATTTEGAVSSTTTTVGAATTLDTSTTVSPPRGTALDETRTLLHDDRERSYLLYLPASLPSSGSVPVVVALHGGTGWAEQHVSSAHWRDVAEGGAFALVAPDGVGIGPRQAQTWNGGEGYCCGPAMNQGVDDVGFLVALVDEVALEVDVDRARVFAAGHSNGGIMSYRLACEAADTFVAIGVVAGSLGVDDCTPSRPVSVLHIHGGADENHPYEGGRGSRSIQPSEFNAVLPGLETMAELNGCATQTTFGVDGPVTVARWTDCGGGALVELRLIADASHAWPGGTVLAPQLQGEPSDALDATRVIWEFFATIP
jgi:polyhydroxybutyrate depolymerase